jgi:hypothetical protein
MRVGPKQWIAHLASKGIRKKPSVAIDGMRLFFDAEIAEARRHAAIDRLANAISFIEANDPRWLHRLRRGGTDLYLTSSIGTHGYLEVSNLIVLDIAGVERQTREGLPTSLVHEATHARIALRGISMTRSNTSRIERRCVEEEIAFVRCVMAHVPSSKQAEVDAWVARKRQTLEAPWWTTRKRLGRIADLFADGGAPLFLVRLIRRFARN